MMTTRQQDQENAQRGCAAALKNALFVPLLAALCLLTSARADASPYDFTNLSAVVNALGESNLFLEAYNVATQAVQQSFAPGNNSEAQQLAEQAIQLSTTRYGSNHLDVAKARGVLIVLTKHQRELANAMLMKLETQIGSTGLVENLFLIPVLADLYRNWPPDKMRSCINGVIESKRQRGARPDEIADFLDVTVQALMRMESHQLAEEYATQLVSVLELSCNTNGLQYANAILYIGRSNSSLQQYDKAEKHLKQTLSLMEALGDSSSYNYVVGSCTIVDVLMDTKRWQEAVTFCIYLTNIFHDCEPPSPAREFLPHLEPDIADAVNAAADAINAAADTAERNKINAQPLPPLGKPDAAEPASAMPDWANVFPPVRSHPRNFSIYPQLRLPGQVTGLLFSPDARYLAAAGNGKLKVWNLQARRELREITNVQYFAGVTYNATSWWVLCTGKYGNYISLCDIINDTIALTFQYTNGRIRDIASSADGRYCAVGDYDGTLSLYDLNVIAHSKQRSAQLPVIAPLWSAHATSSSGRCEKIAFMPDGSRIASAYRGCFSDYIANNMSCAHSSIDLRDIVSGTLVSTISNLPLIAETLQFTSDSHYLLLSDLVQTRLFDVASCKLLRITKPLGINIADVALLPNTWTVVSRHVNIPYIDRSMLIMKYDDLNTMEGTSIVIHISTDTDNGWRISIQRAAPNGAYAAVGCDDGSVDLWDLRSLRRTPMSGNCAAVDCTAVTFNRDYASAGADKKITIWNLVDGVQSTILTGLVTGVSSAAFSSDGRFAYAATQGDFLHCWDAASGYTHSVTKVLTQYTPRLVVSPDGQYLICDEQDSYKCITYNRDNSIARSKNVGTRKIGIYDAHNYQSVATLRYPASYVEYAGGGYRTFASTNSPPTRVAEATLKQWESEIGTNIVIYEGIVNPLTDVQFTSSGSNVVAVYYYGHFAVWNAPAFTLLATFQVNSNMLTRSYGISPNGDTIVDTTRTGLVFRADTGEVLAKVSRGRDGSVEHVDLCPDTPVLSKLYWEGDITIDNHRALRNTRDGAIRLWDTVNNKEIAAFIGFRDDEWIVITPEGYYNSSPKGDKYLNVRIGNRVYGAENFRKMFYRPDLVRLALAGGSLARYQRMDKISEAPIVTVTDVPSVVSNSEVMLTAKFDDIGGGVGEVRVYLNGSAIVMTNESSRGGALERRYTIRLVNGINTIRVAAYNQDNTMESAPAEQEITAHFSTSTKPALHAVVIGINDYKNPSLKLEFAAADAQLFVDSLRSGASRMYDRLDIRMLTTPEETSRENIIKQLQALRAVQPQDLFVLFVAAHGVLDEDSGEYFMLTSSVGSTTPKSLRETGITQDGLTELVANIPTTKKLVLLDTCNAQAAANDILIELLQRQRKGRTRGMSEEAAMRKLSGATGSAILSATTQTQGALEGYKGHGLFSYVVAEGLDGKADTDHDGYVKTTELADYVDNEVPALAKKALGREQYPTAAPSGEAFPVVKVK